MTRKLSRIVISSVSEKSLSFATKQAMFGTLKRETFYPLPFGHRPIYIRGEAATFISNSSFLIRAKLSFRVKGRHAPWANPEPYFIPLY